MLIVAYILTALAELWVITLPISLTAKMITMAALGVPAWLLRALVHPLIWCRWCERGRTYDAQGEHFAEACPGMGLLHLWSCGASGKKLRWEIKALHAVGMAGHIEDPRNLED